MEIFVLRVFPGLLAVGSLVLAWHEMTQETPRPGKSNQWRLTRRLGGSLTLLAIAFQIWTGRLPGPDFSATASQDEALALLQHWVSVFGLVCLLLILALWDAWAGVRQLRGYLDTVEKAELGAIRDHLGKNPQAHELLKRSIAGKGPDRQGPAFTED